MKKTKKARKNGKKKGNDLTKAGYDRISKAYEDRLYLLNYATSTRTTYLSNYRCVFRSGHASDFGEMVPPRTAYFSVLVGRP